MSENIIDIGKDILKQVDIVEIISSFLPVSKKGRNFVCLCPFHDDKNPSLFISQEKQIFKCFTCGTSGNAISFVKRYKNCSYFDAVQTVAQIAGINDERLKEKKPVNNISEDTKKIYECLESIDKYYSAFLFQTNEGRENGLEYLHKRQLSDEIINKFHIGYALKNNQKLTEKLLKDGYSIKTIERTGIGRIFNNTIQDNNAGRVIFSITNEDNQVVGFSARHIGVEKDIAKYINSPEIEDGVFHKSSLLYNYFNAKDSARRSKFIYLVEGFMDAIALERIGIDNVVALMGVALTNNHIRLLRFLNCEIRLCLDNDEAGQSAMIKISKQLSDAKLSFRFVSNKNILEYKDSDEILQKNGQNSLKTYLSDLISQGEYILNYYTNKYDMTDLNNKKLLLVRYIPFLAQVNNEIDYEMYSKKLAEITGFSFSLISSQVNAYKAKQENLNIGEENYQKELFKNNNKKSIKILELNERLIVRYMLENKNAVIQYGNKLGYLVNDDYRHIANLIEEYLESEFSDDYSLNNLINFINGYDDSLDEKQRNKIIDDITLVTMSSFKCPPYTTETFNDCVKIINFEKEKQRSYEAYSHSSIGKSDEEKAKQAKALIEKRCELIAKREKGND